MGSCHLLFTGEARFTTKFHLRNYTYTAMMNMQQADIDHKTELLKRPDTKQQVLDYIMSVTKSGKQ